MTSDNWWRRATLYQIYPRSFQDSDGDGVGDLAGVIDRLDYLVWLGIDAIWLSPFYPSPMQDFGYDVSDYCDVDPLFGTLEIFDRLLAQAHARGLKIIIDLVPNHTSDQHPWFVESRKSRDNPKRDWYLWRDAHPDGGPPNNWLSHFGGSGWTWDPGTEQYYYHGFLAAQPDLNWRNPAVCAAIQDVMRFWLRRGVDGFRVDVISHLIKDEFFRDNPSNPEWHGAGPDIARLTQAFSADRPEVHAVIAGLRRVVDEFPDRVLIGEVYLPIARLVAYYGAEGKGVHFPFNFHLLDIEWRATRIASLIADYEAHLPQGCWPNWVLSNHDRPRIAARVGETRARLAAMLLLTLRGTPTFYYGDEIGLGDVYIPPDRVQDPWARNEPGAGVGRDPARTPMQWDRSRFAGFSSREPWLPLSPDHERRNVEIMRADSASILCLVRQLLSLRRAYKALAIGDWRRLDSGADVLFYARREGAETVFIALNFSSDAQILHPPAPGRLILSTRADRMEADTGASLSLRGEEAVIIVAI